MSTAERVACIAAELGVDPSRVTVLPEAPAPEPKPKRHVKTGGLLGNPHGRCWWFGSIDDGGNRRKMPHPRCP